MSRVDDIINVAGHRLSTGAMEEVLVGPPGRGRMRGHRRGRCAEGRDTAGLRGDQGGRDDRSDAEIVRELVERVREHIGPVAAFKLAIVVKRLPKTRSGKILRGTMKKIADGTDYTLPATIDDPAILEEITAALNHSGYPAKAPA